MIDALAVGLAVVSLAAPVTRTPAAELDPAWSADGRLVFARPDAIVIADPRRGTVEQILVPKAREPRLSPDGRLVAFGGRRGVEVQDVHGGGARLLGYGGGPRWSPDGRLLAYTRGAAPSKGGYVYVVAPDGTGERRVAGNGYDPDWSPDGAHLAFTAGWSDETSAIATVRVAGGEPTELPVRGGGWRDRPAWSPDGSRVAYVFGAGNWAAIFVQRIAGGPRRQVSVRLPAAWGVSWRPDGGALAFAGGSSSAMPRIHLVSLAGRTLRTIPGSERGDYGASWTPDGRMLAFLSERDCGTRVYIAAGDGSNPRPLTPTDGRPCLIRSNEAFVKGYSTADDLRGGRLSQDLVALGGNDTIAPGGGRDDVQAGAGNDRVYARDGRQDTIRCGTGKDVVLADRIDRVGPSCETIRRS